MKHPQTLDRLKSIVGPKGWIRPGNAEKYFADPRERFHGSAALILRPASTKQVSDVVKTCNDARIGIIPFGGGTGGVAGHMETGGKMPVVVSLERMNAIRHVSVDDNAIVAEAGCILADIRQEAQNNRRRLGLSLASEGSCSIGGNLASNAGGVQVLRYGNSRDLCLGLEVVMPDGSVLDDLKPLRKDNTGYDLKQLLIGSEGTLGIITAVTLKLFPQPEESVTVMGVVGSPSGALALLQSIRDRLGECVSAFELMSGMGVTLAKKHFAEMKDPFNSNHEWYVLAEIEGFNGIRAGLEDVLAQQLEHGTLVDAVIAESDSQSQTLWNFRELAYEYNQREGAICSSDTSVPISQIENFIRKTDAEILRLDPKLRTNRYGHVGDGNIHVNVFAPEGQSKQDYLLKHEDVRESTRMIINEVTDQCGGSISAEHGIGRLKIEDLNRYANPTKLAFMQTIKQAVDPNGIMNPGALFHG